MSVRAPLFVSKGNTRVESGDGIRGGQYGRAALEVYDHDLGVGMRAHLSDFDGARYSPRHRHNIDQVRLILSGKVKYGPREVYGPGTCIYIPEGVRYGPLEAVDNEPQSGVTLQFPGPSGYPVPCHAEQRAVQEQMRMVGKFESGIYTRPDGRKQESFEAMLEQWQEREVEYPPARYASYVALETENYPWEPLADVAGVQVRHLGYFNSVGPNLKLVKVKAGASLPPGPISFQQMRYLIEGRVSYEGAEYDGISVGYFPAHINYAPLVAEVESLFFVIQLALPTGDPPPFCRL
jgi:hypothetical protein